MLMTGDAGRAARPPRTAAAPGRRASRSPATSASRSGRSRPRERDDARRRPGDRRRAARRASCRPTGWPSGPSAAIADLEAHARARSRTARSPWPCCPTTAAASSTRASILAATPSRTVLVHEVAHMWFYGMVGNSQFRDPWLDEAFATLRRGGRRRPRAAGRTGRRSTCPATSAASMAELPATTAAYFTVVYGKGAAALLAARDAGRRRRRSTRRCAATSTPTPGRSPPRPTSPPPSADLPDGAGAALGSAEPSASDDRPALTGSLLRAGRAGAASG